MAHTQGKCGRLGVGEICRESPRFHSLIRESTGQWWAMTVALSEVLAPVCTHCTHVIKGDPGLWRCDEEAQRVK
jgi:hypothetical protein